MACRDFAKAKKAAQDMTTWYPERDRALAALRPSPELAPVMMAVGGWVAAGVAVAASAGAVAASAGAAAAQETVLRWWDTPIEATAASCPAIGAAVGATRLNAAAWPVFLEESVDLDAAAGTRAMRADATTEIIVCAVMGVIDDDEERCEFV